jgi:diadenosine tetraphosphate (Ap4A) HIT family hydrolase
MNYLALMMVEYHVHYHVIPRYEGNRFFSDLEWIDNGWPALPVMSDAQHNGNDEVLGQIRKTLSED